MPSGDMSGDELRDRMLILDLLARATRGMDRADSALIASCYTDDSVEYHGPFVGSGQEWAVRPTRTSPANVASHHQLGQTVIDLDGDGAFAETYCIYHGIHAYQDGRRVSREYFVRYLDTLRRVDGAWKIAIRRVVADWGYERTESEGWIGVETYERGTHFPDDPVYRFASGAPTVGG
jgi:hypothetical protein